MAFPWILITKKVSILAVGSAFLGGVAVLWAFGCASSGQAPAVAANHSATRSSTPPSGVPMAPAPDASLVADPQIQQLPAPDAGATVDAGSERHAPISSPCVLHAGQGSKHTRHVRSPGGGTGTETVHGSCSANAECIVKKARQTTGDGFVRLECSERACTCRLEPLVSHVPPITSTFELSAPCTTSSEALKLLVERCMPDMAVVGRH